VTSTAEKPPLDDVTTEYAPEPNGPTPLGIVRAVGSAVAVVALLLIGVASFGFLRDSDANRAIVVLVAIAVGVGGVFLLFWAMDQLVDRLPTFLQDKFRPYVFVGPALFLLGVFLVYPVINTLIMSFRDSQSKGFVGLDNYRFVFTDESMRRAIRNTLAWIVFVPAVAVSVGLLFATLADRLRRGEAIAKSVIFLPMAISFVGAAITFRLIYSFRPQGFGSNIGLLNAIVIGLGREPISWLSRQPWNNVLLMLIMVWMQTGFAMVVLSAAIKSIPDEIIEAARIDGASEFQVFRSIIVPSILPTIVVVTTYMVINALKVFDIVFVIGNAQSNGTEVIAERMIRWFFISNNDGRGAAIAVVLFLAVVPVMVWNVRKFREQEAIR
jgi:alpha-glucoside transport system permease protein